MGSTRTYDTVFLSLVSALVLVGLFMLASASIGLSVSRFGHPYYYFLHQVLFGLLPGVIFLLIASHINYKFWRNISLPLLFFSIILMFLVFVPDIGFYHGGARRWLTLGPISFQPAELLKFSFVVYLASWLETRTKEVRSFKFGLVPFAIMSSFIGSLLILQPDIGTLIVILASAVALFFLRGGALKQIAILGLILLIVIGALVAIEPYRLDRFKVFFNPTDDLQGKGYQIHQALIAAGSGGFWGRGFALSRQKFSFLPEPIGDSVFAVIAEEIGFVGSVTILSLFLLFFMRGVHIAKNAPDLFGKLLCSGILFLIMIQALVNISAILGIIPLTGIPLSFVSYGGSALAVMLLQIGIILNISKYKEI